eukprot:CAMPEP_0184368086 /NCGR_PEP_ID=MMETSP1089-20130417/161232_1 /TAXON_ID=38269 ORGANISM="Gloeochaete wittrockiana, Strain SAG46.84" /NCGR_SAMPLE_ID=MMETSP1089 /ASSEMBLY_ACC=CAM_ASM_000445 /LENGTH=149 /DNA_ID=CAMNT_0026710267 /DNA_START=35 /DNA_END=481 /DNA_ORIENTATION=+
MYHVHVGDRVAYSGPNMCVRVGDLEPGTEYTVTVQAENEAGVGPCSEVTHARTLHGPPPQPIPPRMTSRTGSSLTVEFKVDGDQRYGVTFYTLRMDGHVVHVAPADGDVTSYEATGLNFFSEHTFEVMITNPAGDSPFSDPLIARTSPG